VPTSILITIFGFVVLAFGLRYYLGHGRHTPAKRLWMFIWLGLCRGTNWPCFSLVGLGGMIARRPITDTLMAVGLGCGVVAARQTRP
jgi:hypothetical protein